MNIDSSILDIIGIVYSGLALAISLPAFIVLETPTKSLIYLQLSYLISSLGAVYSAQLEVSCANITLSSGAISNFYEPISSFVSLLAFPLSFLVFLVGFMLIMRLITIPEKVREKGLTYHRVHRWCKGLIRWVAMYITYYSIFYIVSLTSDKIAPSAVMLSAFVLFPIIQLILYWKFPEEKSNDKHKWI